MPKRIDSSLVTPGVNFDGANTVTTEDGVTEILPEQDNKVDLGSPTKRYKNIYWSSLTPFPGDGYLKLDGSTPMQGNLQVGINAVNLTTSSDLITPQAGTINLCQTGNRLRFVDSGSVVHDLAETKELAAKLDLAGGTMSGDIALGTHNLTNVGNVSGSTNTRNANDIVSCATNGVAGNVPIYSASAKVVQDSGTALSSLATNASLGNYLAKSGGVMTGSIDMGAQEVQNCSAFRINTMNMKTVIGSSSTSSGSNYTTQVGGLNTIDALSVAATSVGYGNDVKSSSGPTLIGAGCIANNAFASTIVGNGCSATNCTDSVVIGHNTSSTANYGHAIGYNIANSTANSLLVDCSSNIRSNSTTCDLGTAAKPFQNLHLNGYALSSDVSKCIPATRCTLSNTTIGFSATTAETSIIQGTLSGSLTIPPPTTAGFTMKMSGDWLYSAGVVTTFTVRFKVNGTTCATTTIPAGIAVNQDIHVEHTIQLRSTNNRLYIACRMIRNGATPVMNGTIIDNIWLPAGSNTISMTGQFNDTNGTWRGDSFDLWSSYAS